LSFISADVSKAQNTTFTACLLTKLGGTYCNANHVIYVLKCYNIARCWYEGGRVEIPAEISQTQHTV